MTKSFTVTVNKTSLTLPNEDQEVFYWFEPFEKWYKGQFDGEWHFYSRHGFCDGHDAPYWFDAEMIDPRDKE